MLGEKILGEFEPARNLSTVLKAGVNLNAVFSPLFVSLTEISCSRFKQFKTLNSLHNSMIWNFL